MFKKIIAVVLSIAILLIALAIPASAWWSPGTQMKTVYTCTLCGKTFETKADAYVHVHFAHIFSFLLGTWNFVVEVSKYV